MIALQSVKDADIGKMGKMRVGTSIWKCYVFGAPARVRTRDPLITNPIASRGISSDRLETGCKMRPINTLCFS